VFGRQELENFRLQKQALVLQSGLNRLALQLELQQLRSATAWMTGAARAPRQLAPLWVVLAPLAGFFLVRSFRRRPESLFNRLASAAKWFGPLYTLWRSFSAGRKKELEAP
jgi:hypothetical protein